MNRQDGSAASAEAMNVPEPVHTLSEADIRFIAYFAMGVTSEGSIGGRNVAYELRFAGTIHPVTGRMSPVANSGYSLGTLQTDIGQHPHVAAEVVAAYQDWAAADHAARAGWVLEPAQEAGVVRDLMRRGNEIRTSSGVDIPAATKSRINAFLGSSEGITYVHARDVAQIDHLMRDGPHEQQGALGQLQRTTQYRQASSDDQVRFATIFAKLENQAGSNIYPRILQGMASGNLSSIDEVKASLASRPKYVVEGVGHALSGAELFIKLRNAHPDNPLVDLFQGVASDPLVNPATPAVGLGQGTSDIGADERPGSAVSYAIIKDLFLQPEVSRRFVAALDAGASFTYGQPARGGPGFYVSGNDFVLWNSDGNGHAHIDGQWAVVSRRQLTRVNNPDGTVLLNIEQDGLVQTMLRIDLTSPAAERRAPVEHSAGLPMPAPGELANGRADVFRDGVDHHVRALYDSQGVDAGLYDLDSVAMRVAADASRHGLQGVTRLRFSVEHSTGQPDPTGNIIAWQGDPRDPAAKWSVTPVGERVLADAAETGVDYRHAVPRQPVQEPREAFQDPQRHGSLGM